MERILAADTSKHLKEKIFLQGWVQTRRDHGGIIFIDLRDRSGLVQLVFGSGLESKVYELVKELRPEDVIEIIGIVNQRPKGMENLKISSGQIEVSVEDLKILSKAQTLPFEIGVKKPDLNLDTYLDLQPLVLRNENWQAVFKIQSGIIRAFRDFFKKEEFVEIQVPKIVGGSTEGGAEVFKVRYFEKTAYLAQSPQFYKQILVGVFERVFCLGDVFRAEKHATSRHLSEYVSLDFEMGFIKDHYDLIKIETKFLKYLINFLQENFQREIKLLKINLPEINQKIPYLHFQEAQRILEKNFNKKCFGEPDLDPEHERLLCEYAVKNFKSEFIFITHYPTVKRPMYTMPDDQDPKFTKSFDLLFRGIEITTGGQRIHNYNQLVENIKKWNCDPNKFKFYLQAFKYSMPPHGGAGTGLERLTQKIVGLKNIREATLFPRDMNRIDILLHRARIAK